jgi:lipopolysaccharide heptosyltransferase II
VPTLDVHAVDRYLNVGSLLGFDDDPADFSFPIPQAASARIATLLHRRGIGENSRVLTMAPGTIWETKHWDSEKFAEVARFFLQRGFAVALAGSPRERAVCDEVASLAPGVVNFAGETTLSELAALIDRSTICVTNDSGPMHLAVALDRPIVSIFGPTDPVWIGPYRRDNAVLQAKISCAPCYLRELRRCPNDHACMKEVPAQAVIELMDAMLRGGSPAARTPSEPSRAATSH